MLVYFSKLCSPAKVYVLHDSNFLLPTIDTNNYILCYCYMPSTFRYFKYIYSVIFKTNLEGRNYESHFKAEKTGSQKSKGTFPTEHSNFFCFEFFLLHL